MDGDRRTGAQALTPPSVGPVPGLPRRLFSAAYDALLLLAVLLVAGLPAAALTLVLPHELAVAVLRIYLLLVAAGYFTLFWRKGQTLAMKTWRIRLQSADGGMPSQRQVWLRFLFACLTLAPLGLGWWVALWRDDRQFLHDHLAGTRLVRSDWRA